MSISAVLTTLDRDFRYWHLAGTSKPVGDDSCEDILHSTIIDGHQHTVGHWHGPVIRLYVLFREGLLLDEAKGS